MAYWPVELLIQVHKSKVCYRGVECASEKRVYNGTMVVLRFVGC